MTEITRDEYQELRDIVIESRNDIKHINERLIEYIEAHNRKCEKCFEDHENRLRAIESWQTRAMGAVAAIGAIAGIIGNWFLGIIQGGGH